jgi:hypothetical protein
MLFDQVDSAGPGEAKLPVWSPLASQLSCGSHIRTEHKHSNHAECTRVEYRLVSVAVAKMDPCLQEPR